MQIINTCLLYTSLLAENAMKDICAPGNPVEFTKEQIIELYKKIV